MNPGLRHRFREIVARWAPRSYSGAPGGAVPAHNGGVYVTHGRAQGRDSAVVCASVLRKSGPCVRFW